jgi:hypothetical protein
MRRAHRCVPLSKPQVKPTPSRPRAQKGVCRLSGELAAELASSTLLHWRECVAPWVERVAHELASVAGTAKTTRLTRRALRQALDSRLLGRQRRKSRRGAPPLPETCRECGARLAGRRGPHCVECERLSGEHTQAQTRSARPAHDKAASERRIETQLVRLVHRGAMRRWNPADLPTGVNVTIGLRGGIEGEGVAWYRTQVLPGLQALAVKEIEAAIGVSDYYARDIRRGRRVPHPRHWQALLSLAREQGS